MGGDTGAEPARLAPAEGGGDRLRGFAYWIALVLGCGGILLTINQTFNLHLTGAPIIDTSFYYLLLGLFLSLAFLAYPAHGAAWRTIPWYDWGLFAACLGATSYLAWNGSRIVSEGWDLAAPPEAVAVAGIVCAIALEAVRRAAGIVLFLICAVFAAYPLFADSMPGFLWGPGSGLAETLSAHAMGVESIIGVPLRTVASLLVGFLIFGSALVVTGGGEFFMALAVALLGRTRGGPAKVSVMASGFFGSLSGSVISNVVTTGRLTIPTMKRVGYPAHYAGAVEACASTGGALMPPVMGAVAFVMAEFLNVPYSTVLIAAIVPALLYYGGLLLQADHYAARNGLKGQPAEEIPPLLPILKEGWHFLFSLGLLVYLLLVMKREALAPYIATCVLLGTTVAFGSKRFGLAGLRDLAIDTTRSIVNLVAVLAGVGFIVGSLSYTGVGGAFSRELLQFAGGNIYLLLVLGALTSFILGMGMTATACYIFLAVTLAPALISGGLHPTASHLFILYWGLMSFITPPVALAAITAASIAKADPWRTGTQAMRLGVVNFLVPFLFVLNPTLIMVGEPLHILHDVATACFAVWMIAATLEGWLVGIGRIAWPARALLAVGALGMLTPGLTSDLVGGALLALVYGGTALFRRRAPARGA
ncbi:C4-dicarboxylate ABC transporter [Caldovatus sediminis]|uniref:C4-dicarboxylate ABC transporter n=1 Tax=Caldovatus sediminis TaxID=2041189 RepID=A0A8J3EDE9_9PROT|nr:TRAP transporter fused permease subunit [Caldovatus sediminis]GGG30043.1 C4-dicarboxylate ABC transporter [Caldovatus sediminis]